MSEKLPGYDQEYEQLEQSVTESRIEEEESEEQRQERKKKFGRAALYAGAMLAYVGVGSIARTGIGNEINITNLASMASGAFFLQWTISSVLRARELKAAERASEQQIDNLAIENEEVILHEDKE
ncbi:hypothetical protein FWF89_00375 [Candidatus Saccharibacteria bacterium]|jgi:hypothetical protein|nr:hypothetical protein [Candidatus Saccharibacteria bacterium]